MTEKLTHETTITSAKKSHSIRNKIKLYNRKRVLITRKEKTQNKD